MVRPNVDLSTPAHQRALAAYGLGVEAIASIFRDVAGGSDEEERLHPFDPLGLAIMAAWPTIAVNFKGCRLGPMTCAGGEPFDTFETSLQAGIGGVFSYPPFTAWAGAQKIPVSSATDILRVGRWWPYRSRFNQWLEERHAPASDPDSRPQGASLLKLRKIWQRYLDDHLSKLWCSPDEVFRAFRSAMKHKAGFTGIPVWKLWAFLWHEMSAVSMPLDHEGGLRRIHVSRTKLSARQQKTNDRIAATHAILRLSERAALDGRFQSGQRIDESGRFCWDCGRATDAMIDRFRKWRRSLSSPTETVASVVMPEGSLDDLQAGTGYDSDRDVLDASAATRSAEDAKKLLDALRVRILNSSRAVRGGSAAARVLREAADELTLGDMAVSEAADQGGCQRSNLSRALAEFKGVIRSGPEFADLRARFEALVDPRD